MTVKHSKRWWFDHIKYAHIQRHSLDVSIPIRKQIEVYKQVALDGDKDLPPIKVAKIAAAGGKVQYWLLADVDVYLGVAAAAHDQSIAEKPVMMKCQIEACDDMTDFLIKHVRYNQRPVGFNPLLLRKVAAYLAEHKGTAYDNDIAKLFQISNTAHQKFLTLDIDDEAVNIITELCGFLAARLSQFILPYYIPYMISKKSRDIQAKVASKISSLIRVRPISDMRFAWPSPEEITILINTPKYGDTYIKDDSSDKAERTQTSFNPVKYDTDVDEDSKAQTHKQAKTDFAVQKSDIIIPDGAKPPTTAALRRSKEIIKSARGVLVIPKGDGHPAYVVDQNTKRVSAVDDSKRAHITKLYDVGATTPYLIPQAAEEWLGLSSASPTSEAKNIKMVTFANTRDVERFIKKHRTARGVILYR